MIQETSFLEKILLLYYWEKKISSIEINNGFITDDDDRYAFKDRWLIKQFIQFGFCMVEKNPGRYVLQWYIYLSDEQ